eukprot:Lankesteria_metandrocarpae@DN3977_c0_g1_i2.p1
MSKESDSNGPITGAFYKLTGHSLECIFSRCNVSVEKDLIRAGKPQPPILLISAAHDDGGSGRQELSIPVHTICDFEQNMSDAFQFIVRTKKDHGDQYGLHLDSESSAASFRDLLEPLLMYSSTMLIKAACAFASYDIKQRTFVPLSEVATVSIWQRPQDFEAFLTVTEEGPGAHHSSGDANIQISGKMLFLDVLSPAMNLWTVPSVSQVVFWGPASNACGKDAASERRMFLVELLVEENSTLNREFFSLLAIVLRERVNLQKVTDRERAVLQEEWSAVESQRVAQRTTEDRFDDQDVEMLPFDENYYNGTSQDTNFSRGNIRGGSISDDSAGGGEVCWRSSNEEGVEVVDSDDDDSTPTVCVDPSRKMMKDNPSALSHKFMEVGLNRTFACRGSQKAAQIQLYKPTGDPSCPLESTGTIQGKHFESGGSLVMPSRGLLHDGESKLLLSCDDRPHEVFMMDLERETIVQKWDADHQRIDGMNSTFKFGQSSHDPTFLCHNQKSVFLMDTRLRDVGRSTGLSYVTNPQFTTTATDESGHILVGSKLGTMRLYDGASNVDGNLKRAKTQLDSVREPLVAVDVSSDGSWVVGTTRSYLVVFPTRLASSGKSGFQVALGKNKPAPRYLRLRVADIKAYGLTDISFTPAKFSGDEESIVSSTGNLAVIWDLRSVMKRKPRYTIKKAHSFIKDVQVPVDDSSVVVVRFKFIGTCVVYVCVTCGAR